jgi:hypothetical protein
MKNEESEDHMETIRFDDETMEQIRGLFFRATNIDLAVLSANEVTALLRLLPLVIVFLNAFYDLSFAFSKEKEESEDTE